MKKYIKQIAAFAFIATLASCSADDNMEFASTGGNAAPATTSISRLDNNYNLPLNTYTKEGVTVSKVEIFKNTAKTTSDPIVLGAKVSDATLSEGKATFNTSTLGSFDNFPVTANGVTTLTGKTGTFELAILATYSDGTTSQAPFTLTVGKAITWQVKNSDGDLANSSTSGVSTIKINDPAPAVVNIAPLTKAATTITSIVGQWSKDGITYTDLPETFEPKKQSINLNKYDYDTYGTIVAGDKITYKFIITSGTQTDFITTTVTFADQVFGASHVGNISDSESTFSFSTGTHDASEIDFVSPFGFATSEDVSIDFVKANALDYATANLFAAEAAYNAAGTKATSLTNLVVGDVIVYKITRSVNFGTEDKPKYQNVLYTGIIEITDKVAGTTSQELKFSYKEGVLAK